MAEAANAPDDIGPLIELRATFQPAPLAYGAGVGGPGWRVGKRGAAS